MRVGSFRITGTNGAKADISIIPLPEQSAKDLENVNRWRSQVGAAGLTEEQLATNAEPIRIAGQPAQLFEMAGPSVETDEPTRILGAIQHRRPMSWFFKLMGDEKLVAAQKPVFLEFLASYHFPHSHDEHSHGAAGGNSEADPHAGLPIAPAGSRSESAPPGDWPIPASWTRQAAGPMQDAKFVAQEGKVVISVSRAGGNMIMNVNRWREQLGMAAIAESELGSVVTPLELPGGKADVVDLGGATQRMIVAVVPKGPVTLFYKMVGPPDAVAAEKEALIKFVKAVQ
jgi:hypothetical protein